MSRAMVFLPADDRGMPSGDDSPAEEAVFAEYDAAVEATRAGIEASAAGVTAH